MQHFCQSSWYRGKTKKEVEAESRDSRARKQKEAKENQMLQMPLPNAKDIHGSSALLEQFHRGACKMRTAGGQCQSGSDLWQGATQKIVDVWLS